MNRQQLSDDPLALATPGDPTSRVVQFYNETLRLWYAEEGKVGLTAIQAIVPFALGLEKVRCRHTSFADHGDRMSLMAIDGISMTFIERITSMSRDLLAPNPKSRANMTEDQDLKKSQSLALWGCFALRVSVLETNKTIMTSNEIADATKGHMLLAG